MEQNVQSLLFMLKTLKSAAGCRGEAWGRECILPLTDSYLRSRASKMGLCSRKERLVASLHNGFLTKWTEA